MSFYQFPRNGDGEIEVSDDDVFEAIEILINQIALLNARFEEVHETGLTMEDIE